MPYPTHSTLIQPISESIEGVIKVKIDTLQETKIEKENIPSEFLWKVSGMRSSCLSGAPVTGCLPNFLMYGIMFLHPISKPNQILHISYS